MTIKQRLRKIEDEVELERHVMTQRIQLKLGLPLPPEADRTEGLRRLKAAIAEEEFEPFKKWADEQHQKFVVMNP